MIRKALALASAAALAISPAIAQANAAIPAADAAKIERAGAKPGQEQLMSTWFVPTLVVLGLILAGYLILDGGDDTPASP